MLITSISREPEGLHIPVRPSISLQQCFHPAGPYSAWLRDQSLEERRQDKQKRAPPSSPVIGSRSAPRPLGGVAMHPACGAGQDIPFLTIPTGSLHLLRQLGDRLRGRRFEPLGIRDAELPGYQPLELKGERGVPVHLEAPG